jgi:hypothetical protein
MFSPLLMQSSQIVHPSSCIPFSIVIYMHAVEFAWIIKHCGMLVYDQVGAIKYWSLQVLYEKIGSYIIMYSVYHRTLQLWCRVINYWNLGTMFYEKYCPSIFDTSGTKMDLFSCFSLILTYDLQHAERSRIFTKVVSHGNYTSCTVVIEMCRTLFSETFVLTQTWYNMRNKSCQIHYLRDLTL